MKNVSDVYPLSPLQQGMFFHTLYAPQAGVYFEQLSFTLAGNLNVSALKQAWQQVMERHSAFRTALIWEGLDEPLQVVLKQVQLPWQEQNWCDLSPLQQQQQLMSFLSQDRKQGFDFSQAPLMRLTLIHISDNLYKFIWSHHHLIIDGWSIALTLKEVFLFYEAYCNDKELHLDHSRPYRDYIAWLQQQDIHKAERFWREVLTGFTNPTTLIVEKHFTVLTEEVEKQVEVAFSPRLTTDLQTLARQHQLTLNTLVQGAWAILLSHYNGLEDIVLGVIVSGRPPELSGIEDMVGLFINTLPLRVKLPVDKPVLNWLESLQALHIEMQQYEYVSLTQIQGWSAVPRNRALFESIYVFENYPVDNTLSKLDSKLHVNDININHKTNYPISLVVTLTSQLLLKLSYDSSRCEADTITRMLGHLQVLLEGIVADPLRSIFDIPLLNEVECQQIIEWNNTNREYPTDLCIHQLFEAQVKKVGARIAVVFGQQQLSYEELNRRANQLAHLLCCLGVGPEVVVGICMERSLDMIVGLLAILKAGGAYLPLDPSSPLERLASMIIDSQIKLLLTQQQIIKSLSTIEHQIVCIDRDWPEISSYSEENPINRTVTDNLAYVVYTSGSTGQPKGIAIPHKAVNRLVLNTDYVQLGTKDTIAQASNASFDAVTFEIWGALLNGAKLIVVSKEVVLVCKEFATQIQEQGINTLFLTTALFNQLAQQEPRVFNSLKQVLFGGEQVEPKWVWKVMKAGGPARLLHVYGPTENTTFSSWQLIVQIAEAANTISIGLPIANTQIYILDTRMRAVPIGVAGELYIGGAGLARGYFKNVELTAEKFVPHPYSKQAGARLYRSGDWGRYRTDGSIEFIGRIDNQVKLRGFRIELGEIEAKLNEHRQVRECVVVASEGSSIEKRLIAYLVTEAGENISTAQLQHYLQDRLPEYMLPSAYVQIERLPLTANGKVDRRALPAPDYSRTDIERTITALRNPLEEVVAAIWTRVLAIARVSIDDNFFELGGHSLLATQVISQVRSTFKVE
ncbi:MAG: amino acid adenylation domain-containing protein, partial [Acidobacteriota bacterium]